MSREKRSRHGPNFAAMEGQKRVAWTAEVSLTRTAGVQLSVCAGWGARGGRARIQRHELAPASAPAPCQAPREVQQASAGSLCRSVGLPGGPRGRRRQSRRSSNGVGAGAAHALGVPPPAAALRAPPAPLGPARAWAGGPVQHPGPASAMGRAWRGPAARQEVAGRRFPCELLTPPPPRVSLPGRRTSASLSSWRSWARTTGQTWRQRWAATAPAKAAA
jgi:hypothetical protein